MRWKSSLSIIAAALAVSVALLGVVSDIGRAQSADEAAVKALVSAFFAAFAARDIAKMEPVWAREPYVTVINPRDKAPSIGWTAARKNFDDAMNFWAEIGFTVNDGPRVRVVGNMATALTAVTVEGKNKAGQAVAFKVLGTQTFEKKGDRWLMIATHASRIPD